MDIRGGSPGLSFTQGFLLGQLTVVILIGAFIKFFIFGEAPSESSSSRRDLSTLSSSHKRSNSFTSPSLPQRAGRPATGSSHVIRPLQHSTPATILAKTYYNVNSHPPESLDWFNVLLAQTLAQLRADAYADDAILTSLTSVLNGPHKPDFLEDISITEISMGDDYPIFSNCRIFPVTGDGADLAGSAAALGGGGGRLQARLDVDLSDFITLGIETTMVLNFPRPRTAVLPVALSVSVVRFSGTLAISFLPATNPLPAEAGGESTGPSSRRTPTTLAFSFLPNYTLSLSTRSLLGARSRLQDVPKIAQLVEYTLRNWFEERCVQPRIQQIVLPSLWPRMKNVVESEGQTDANTGAETPERVIGNEQPAVIDAEAILRRQRSEVEGMRRRALERERQRDTGRSVDLDMPGSMPGALLA